MHVMRLGVLTCGKHSGVSKEQWAAAPSQGGSSEWPTTGRKGFDSQDSRRAPGRVSAGCGGPGPKSC